MWEVIQDYPCAPAEERTIGVAAGGTLPKGADVGMEGGRP